MVFGEMEFIKKIYRRRIWADGRAIRSKSSAISCLMASGLSTSIPAANSPFHQYILVL